jgi:hypothetical protein
VGRLTAREDATRPRARTVLALPATVLSSRGRGYVDWRQICTRILYDTIGRGEFERMRENHEQIRSCVYAGMSCPPRLPGSRKSISPGPFLDGGRAQAEVPSGACGVARALPHGETHCSSWRVARIVHRRASNA